MNDSSEADPSRSLSNLTGSIRELDALLRGERVTGDGILCQVAKLDLASQVLEAARATLLLQLSDVPRTNWTTARLAFEAMHDLFYLLELCPDRQAAGAKIYVGAVFARKRAEGRLQGIPVIEQRNAENEAPSLRGFVRAEATRIAEIDPGAEQPIMRALEERLKGGDHHWSGLPRRQMTKSIRDKLDDPQLAAGWDAAYYGLSVHAHPKLRIGDAIKIEPGRFENTPDTLDDTPCDVASAAAQTVSWLLKRHMVRRTDGLRG